MTIPVKQIMKEDWYNLLCHILDDNIDDINETISADAEKLFNKIKNYGRIRENEDGEYADLRFFESEASRLIWQLLYSVSAFMPPEDNYFLLHKEEKQSDGQQGQ